MTAQLQMPLMKTQSPTDNKSKAFGSNPNKTSEKKERFKGLDSHSQTSSNSIEKSS
jgi:hypothetical protein